MKSRFTLFAAVAVCISTSVMASGAMESQASVSRVRTVPSSDQKKKDEKKTDAVKIQKQAPVVPANTEPTAMQRPCSQNLNTSEELVITAEYKK